MLYTGEKLSSTIFWCLSVCEASVSPDQISTFSNIYRHTSPLLTMYHLISSSTNLYWPSTSQYRHILTQYHQVPLIIHHLMSHAQYTWSSFHLLSFIILFVSFLFYIFLYCIFNTSIFFFHREPFWDLTDLRTLRNTLRKDPEFHHSDWRQVSEEAKDFIRCRIWLFDDSLLLSLYLCRLPWERASSTIIWTTLPWPSLD